MKEKSESSILLFEQLVNAMPYYVFWKDKDLNYLGCNDLFAKSAGYEKASDLIGKCDYDCCWTKEESDFFRSIDQKVMRENQPMLNMEEPQKQLDGSTNILLTSKVPLRDEAGNVVGVLGMYTDITENKRKDQVHYENEVFLKAIWEAFPNMIFVKEAEELKFKLFNKAGEKLLGLNREELYGKNDYDFFPLEQARFFQNKDFEVLKSQKIQVIPEEKIETASGARLLKTIKVPILDQQGNPKYLLGISEDITEKKMLEKKAFHNAKLASIGELSAGIGHEISNPLMVIAGSLFNIRDEIRLGDFNPEEIERGLQKVESAAARIKKIVKGLRNFSRSDSEEMENFDVGQMISETVGMMKEIYWRDQVDLEWEFPEEDLLYYNGNRGRLQQVLVNLLMNAKDATKNTSHKYVNVNLEYDSERIQILVSDTGMGISKDVRQKIFQPFFTTKGVDEGTGLGLSLVQNIVRDHQGEVHVESKTGEGTKFLVHLPRVRKEDTVVSAPDLREYVEVDGAPCKVMIVDDEQDNLDMVKVFLSSLGCESMGFLDSREALNYLESHPQEIDVVISDMRMPNWDGLEFAKEIRCLASIQQPKFILMTGGASIEFDEENGSYASLVDGYLYKPFDDDDILALLNQFFRTEKIAA